MLQNFLKYYLSTSSVNSKACIYSEFFNIFNIVMLKSGKAEVENQFYNFKQKYKTQSKNDCVLYKRKG